MAYPTHRHASTGAIVFPEGYDGADVSALGAGEWTDHLVAVALAELREERTRRLAACDYTQMADYPISHADRDAWAAYRQALRDLPETANPLAIVWPEPPAIDP